MEIEFATEKVNNQCNSVKAAKKLFGGDEMLARSLHSRVNALKQAEIIRDIIKNPVFRFHALKNKKGKNLEGYFAIDVKTIKEPWRIILQPLDDDKNVYNPCNIDEISGTVRIVKIQEVSNHYE